METAAVWYQIRMVMHLDPANSLTWSGNYTSFTRLAKGEPLQSSLKCHCIPSHLPACPIQL